MTALPVPGRRSRHRALARLTAPLAGRGAPSGGRGRHRPSATTAAVRVGIDAPADDDLLGWLGFSPTARPDRPRWTWSRPARWPAGAGIA